MSNPSFEPVRSSLPLPLPQRKAYRFSHLRRAVRSIIETLENRTLLSTTLTPVADTFVRDHNYALTNFGAAPILGVKNASSGDDRRAFIKFDLTGITSIPSAILQLSGELQNSTATPTYTGVYGVADSSWIEGQGTTVNSNGDTSNNPPGEMTWNNQPAIDATAIATTLVTGSTFQTYTFDVTSYLQQQLADGNTVVTLALENLQQTSLETDFLSRESTSVAGSGPMLIIGDPTTAPPTAVITAPDVSASTSASNEIVTINYSGSAPIDPTTIASSNITVQPYGGGTKLNVEALVGTTVNADGSITAAYTVDAPGGAWAASANGPYVVTVAANSVKDTNGLGIAESNGSFGVSVGDTVAPTFTVTAGDVTSAGAKTYSFSVTYNDNVAINASTIGISNVSVTGPVGPLTITGWSTSPASGNAAQIVVTYTATAPNGGWDATDNGQYAVTVNQVYDTAGNPTAPGTGNFNVAIAIPDTTAPTATIAATNITAPGTSPEVVTVVYTDNIAVLASTITANNLDVIGPGGAPLNVSLANVTGSGQNITATYNVAAPNGAWNASNNGTYSVTILSGQVTDTSGNPLAAVSSNFNVSANVADTQPPTAAIAAPAVNTSGGANEKITVTYTDNVAVAISSIGTANLSVSGPGGPLTVTNFSVSGSGTLVTATYTVASPSGSWSASDDGTYNIALNANQVKDTSGNVAPVTFGSFAINIALPNPSDPTFDGGSAVSYPFVAEATTTQPDGKILLIGHELTTGTASEGVIERLNADGSLDTSFGNKGQIVTPAGNAQWFSVVMQGANHFVVAGTDNGDFALARYDFNGNIDPTFGTSGIALTDFGSPNDMAYAVALSPTGQIVAAGMSNNRFAIARYDANGNIDASFGEDGRQLFDTGAASQVLGAVAVQNDGRIVAAGTSGGNVEVLRLTATGEPDATFSTDGVVAVPGLAADTTNPGVDYTVGLSLQGDGKIVVANRTGSGHFGVVRLNTDGTVDTTFGDNGLATANFGGADEADSVVIQDNGVILVVGTTLINGQPLTAVAAFDPTGALIPSFGENGLATFNTGTSSTTRELHIGQLVLRAFASSTTSGKLLVGASSSGGTQIVTSSLRRILVPGTTQSPDIAESLLGVFGLVKNSKNKLVQTNVKIKLDSTHTAIFSLTGGTAEALQAGNDIHLDEINGGVLTITVKGGGTVTLSNIDVTGTLKSFHAPAAILSGTMSVPGSLQSIVLGNVPGNIHVTGAIASLTAGDVAGTISVNGGVGKLRLGNVSGNVNVTGAIGNLNALSISGTVCSAANIGQARVATLGGLLAAASQITSLTAGSITNATILAGANLGADGQLGGSDDTFAAGTIGALRVNGTIAGSFIGAGVNPVDGTFGNGDDTSAGTGLIKTIFARSADFATHFESSAFGVAKLPKKIDVTTDPAQFIVV